MIPMRMMPPKAPAAPPDAGGPPIPHQEDAASLPAVTPEGEGDSDSAMDDDEMGLPKILPMTAGYMGPEEGPFQCGNCLYFEQNGTCHIVSGPIDAAGCCNLFAKQQGEAPAAEPAEAEMPEAAPETDKVAPEV